MLGDAVLTAVLSAVYQLRGATVNRVEILVGGCISQTQRLFLSDGSTLVAKVCPRAAPDVFTCEAEGLRALAASIRVPDVFAVGIGWILLEDLGPQVSCDELPLAADDSRWDDYARALARVHGRVSNAFGWSHATYWGLMQMDNTPTISGAEFYAERRFAWFMRRPGMARWADADDRRRLQSIADRLGDLVPNDAPVLNHGDIWAGNRAIAADGTLAVIDPFIHNGWAEVDLHNCTMFGGFPARFFDAYRESRPLAPGWRDRLEIWYLLHLLGMMEQHIEVGYALPEYRRITQRFAAV